LAISTNARAAAGAVKWLGSTNFVGSLSSILKNFDV
jgi:hypothetical protein